MEENAVTRAFNIARERYDSLAIVCGIMNITASYAYYAMATGQLSLPCSLKMEVMLDGDVSWRDLCPKVSAEVKTVEDRVAQYV